jgi:hypothetical protein
VHRCTRSYCYGPLFARNTDPKRSRSELLAASVMSAENVARRLVNFHGKSSISPDAGEFKELGPTF